MQTIAIIGGGPAGLIAAQTLSQAGLHVTIYDRMPSMGRKFLLAGRGGLNLTHSEDFEVFQTRYYEALPHLKTALSAFNSSDLRAWCDDLGQKSFIGSSGRVFPESFKTSPLLRAWLERLQKQGVKFKPFHTWQGWDDAGQLLFSSPQGEHIAKPNATLLALGGASWPRMGSDGGWVKILSSQGVDISPLRPANCGFSVNWSTFFADKFQGHPLKRIGLTFNDKTIRAEALVTKSGIEGSGIYTLSNVLREAVLNASPQTIIIDLCPDIDIQALAQKLSTRKKGISLSNHLRKAANLAPVAIALLREGYAQNLNEEPIKLAQALKNVPVHIQSPASLERAISTAGGIKFSEVDDYFRLHKKQSVFVAGEMLDWEAPTGGYLLQASFATGVRAAQGIIKHLSAAFPFEP
jgi:uncharacterized flavoprotein (TIGR03862 family)